MIVLLVVAILLAVTAAALLAAYARLDSAELEREMLLKELRALRTVYTKDVDGRRRAP